MTATTNGVVTWRRISMGAFTVIVLAAGWLFAGNRSQQVNLDKRLHQTEAWCNAHNAEAATMFKQLSADLREVRRELKALNTTLTDMRVMFARCTAATNPVPAP
jgi:hypothetical protein